VSITGGESHLLNAFFIKSHVFILNLVFSPASYENRDHKPAFCLVSIKGKTLGVNTGSVFQSRKILATGRNYPEARKRLDIPTHKP
jgi:hypothetical protein